MDTKSDNQDYAVQFLLQEFQQIDTERLRLRGEAVQRLNFFLTLTSAGVGGFVIFGQPSSLVRADYFLLAILLFLSIIGWQTFVYIVGRDINSDLLLRAGGRIRRYFTNNHLTIQSHLMWQDHDEPSKYITDNDSAIRHTIEAVLAFLLAASIGLLVNIFGQNANVSLAVGVASFIILLAGLEVYATRRFRRAIRKAEAQILHPKRTPNK